ncbi:hypothetical protein ACN28I_04630 [Archangium gephyra]|uniref:hypothetical protein n=1 Tax=Archangium gephyra TaxID=48 RepID=UPI003B8056F6
MAHQPRERQEESVHFQEGRRVGAFVVTQIAVEEEFRVAPVPAAGEVAGPYLEAGELLIEEEGDLGMEGPAVDLQDVIGEAVPGLAHPGIHDARDGNFPEHPAGLVVVARGLLQWIRTELEHGGEELLLEEGRVEGVAREDSAKAARGRREPVDGGGSGQLHHSFPRSRMSWRTTLNLKEGKSGSCRKPL